MANTSFTPTWKPFEKDLLSTDPLKVKKAEEAFETERNKELETSKKARDWESSRKAGWAKDKHQWATEKRKKDFAPLEKMKHDLKVAGSFNVGLKPMPGYVLIKVDEEEKTQSGILLPETMDMLNKNTGTVSAIGDKIIHYVEVLDPPAKVGDHVLFKKGLPGLEVTIKDELYLLMQWSDLLGRFEDA